MIFNYIGKGFIYCLGVLLVAGRKLSRPDYWRIKRNILKKLYSNQAFSKGHMLFERLQSGIPGHLSGFVKPVLSDLIKEQLVLFYGKTKYGDAFQLNIKKLTEIEKIIFGTGGEQRRRTVKTERIQPREYSSRVR